MGRLLARDLEESLYEDEIAARNVGKTVSYYAVTDPDAFLRGINTLFEFKGHSLHSLPGPLKGRRADLEIAFTGGSKKRGRLTYYAIGKNHIEGSVDVVSIPVFNPEFLKATPFENQDRLVFLRSYSHILSRSFEETRSTITGTDLNSLLSNGFGLYRVEDLFTDARGGTDFHPVEELILLRENDLALQRLRCCYEYAMLKWIEVNLALRGSEEKITKPYKDHARSLGIISESDFRQAEALGFAGNAATHHSFMTYSGLQAALFLHWLRDFTGRTIGHHRLAKSKANGDALGNPYQFVRDDFEFGVRGAILDTINTLKIVEEKFPGSFDYISVEGRKVGKESILASAVYVLDQIRSRRVCFEEGEQMCLNFVNYCAKELRGKRSENFSVQDAMRAGVFVHNLFYRSKESNKSRLKGRGIWNGLDVNWSKGVRRKGRGITRFDAYGFQELIDTDETLATNLEFLGKVMASQPEYIQYKV